MKARTYKVTITGETPLLLHNDNLSWAETMKKWSLDPANKKASVAGDDRSPAWRWIGSLYIDNGVVAMPSDNLMTVLREGGKRCPTGKGQSTFKAQTQSGLVVNESAWPIQCPGIVKWADIEPLMEVEDFCEHEARVVKMGFSLFSKRARIGQAKHVRVRPRFDRWACSGSITVMDDMITRDVLSNILTFAGAYAGCGDWRPSSPRSPGSFGRFTATVDG